MRSVLTMLKPKDKISACIDYFRMTFKRHDIDIFLQTVLKMRKEYMLQQPSSKFGYVELYQFDQIRVYNSAPDDERGIMFELGGQGCRQFEGIMDAQNRDWYSFIELALQEGGSITRLDIAIDDTIGYVHIPDCLRFTQQGYVVSKFKTFDFNGSGNITTGEQEGVSIYYGSKSSDNYLVMYQKNYEQAKKQKIDIEEFGVWNRYEIRLKDEKARSALELIMKTKDLQLVAKGVLRSFLRFEYTKPLKRGKAKLNKIKKGWETFLEDVQAIRLSVEPKTNFYRRSENWLRSQASATMKMVQEADVILNRESAIDEMIAKATLSDRQEHMLEVLTCDVSDIIC